MALEWRGSSRWWYGRFTTGGRRTFVNLGVAIEGKRPDRIDATGPEVDPRFIESRTRALVEHDRILRDIRTKGNLEEIQQRIVQLKTGRRLETVPIATLADAWARIPRKHPPVPRYEQIARQKLNRFSTFMAKRWPAVTDLAEVTREHMAAFMEAEAARGIAGRTWNTYLQLLRGTFKHLQPEADAYRHYLVKIPKRDAPMAHRKPFSPEELAKIIEAARADDFLRPLIITAACTAMRRGDVCLLRRRDVDLEGGFIAMKASKTGQTVTIPIFPLLRTELEAHMGPGGPDDYVFPKQAAQFLAGPTTVSERVRVFLESVFSPETDAPSEESRAEIRINGLAHIDASTDDPSEITAKKAAFEAYLGGDSIREIAKAHHLQLDKIVAMLQGIEEKLGVPIIRRRRKPKADDASATSTQRFPRLRAANLRGFHSFRTTWITLALNAGVPMELVRRVTGHQTVEIVLRHYYQPDREDFRRTIEAAMPRMFVAGGKSRDERLREIITRMTPESLVQDRAALLGILDGKH